MDSPQMCMSCNENGCTPTSMGGVALSCFMGKNEVQDNVAWTYLLQLLKRIPCRMQRHSSSWNMVNCTVYTMVPLHPAPASLFTLEPPAAFPVYS
jgi:hypothetical protein